MTLVLILLALIAFIVLSTTRLKLHPFLALLAAALIAGFAYQVPTAEIVKTVTGGFGSILGYIGIVIVLGTIIGVILERSGAAITMAESVIRLLGERFPTLTMSIIGYLVSIPVFCDSGFVILNSLKNALAARMKISTIAMSVALATGLYATHTFVPPTPGPIAAAGNLGLDASLGLVIVVGLVVAFVTAMAGMWWANRFVGKDIPLVDDGQVVQTEEDFSEPACPLRQAAQRHPGVRADLRTDPVDLPWLGRGIPEQAAGRGRTVRLPELPRSTGDRPAGRPGAGLHPAQGPEQARGIP